MNLGAKLSEHDPAYDAILDRRLAEQDRRQRERRIEPRSTPERRGDYDARR